MKGKGWFFSASCMIVVSVCAALLLAGCGGGSSSGAPAISYAGLATPVLIDANNAVEVGTEAYQSGSTAGMIGGSFGVVQKDDGDVGRSRSLVLSQALIQAVRRIDVASLSGGVASGAIQQDSGTEYGSCGGSMHWNISVDDQTGSFTGTFSFFSFCEDGVTMSGSIGVSGIINIGSEGFDQLDMTFTVLTVSAPEGSFSVHGSIGIDFTVTTLVLTMDMYLREDSTGKVYWLNDFIMSMTEGSGYVDMTISGRFYNPDYGYVTITTTTDVRINDTDDYPSSGVMEFTGENNTKARLTCIDSATFRIEADTDGDGSYDYDSGVLNWADL